MRAMFALLTAVFVLAIGARADNVYNYNYNYTGAVQTFTVPAGVTSISVDAYGASSSTISENYEVNNLNGIGLGGRVQGNLSVTPGQTLHLYVGGSSHYAGQSGWPTAYTGWNGGAGGYRRGGGGATDIRIGGTTLDDRVIVSGGGGSGVWYAPGGAGGGLVGGDGSYESGGPGAAKRGQGGTQTAGGLGGGWYDDSPTDLQGSFGYGHIGKTVSGSGGNGHGGGGWYGGGGGADDGAGGGGSSYTDPTLSSSVVHTQGVQTGSGKLTITITAPVVTVISGTDTV
jgi:hypothetical protein